MRSQYEKLADALANSDTWEGVPPEVELILLKTALTVSRDIPIQDAEEDEIAQKVAKALEFLYILLLQGKKHPELMHIADGLRSSIDQRLGARDFSQFERKSRAKKNVKKRDDSRNIPRSDQLYVAYAAVRLEKGGYPRRGNKRARESFWRAVVDQFPEWRTSGGSRPKWESVVSNLPVREFHKRFEQDHPKPL
jgi:hypothetical protein